MESTMKKRGRPIGATCDSMRFTPAPVIREWIESESKFTSLDNGAVTNSLLMKAYAEGISLVPTPKISTDSI